MSNNIHDLHIQDVKQWLASLSERREKINGLMSRVKDLEDELKVAQRELLDRAAVNSKQIKEELTEQCKEHHEMIKQYLEKEIHKCHDSELQATREMSGETENIKEDYIKKFSTLEGDVKAINRGMERNQEDLKAVKEELQTFQARTIATEENLLSIENRKKVLIPY